MDLKGISFQPKSLPREWENVLNTCDFAVSDIEQIQAYWKEYIKNLDISLEEEHEKVRMHQLGKSNPISPLWKNWASNGNTKVIIDFDYSSNLECQRNGKKDKDKRYTDFEEQDFAGALMCCDTPWRTVAFLHEQFCMQHNVSFASLMETKPELERYVLLQMQIAFIGKHTVNFPRPSDYEVAKGMKKSVSLIPHPNHGSLPSGHSCVSQAVKKKLPQLFDVEPTKNWLRLCDECGLARITMGIHWFVDHQASVDGVNEFHELVESYLW